MPTIVSSLVEAKEGMFKVPHTMQRYLDKHIHVKRCLSKECEALFKEHSSPDLPSCTPPKIDKYVYHGVPRQAPTQDGGHQPDQNTGLGAGSNVVPHLSMAAARRVQAQGGPWPPDPSSGGFGNGAVYSMLTGECIRINIPNRHTKILEAVDLSRSGYGTDEFPSTPSTLFGEEFQETLSKKLEKNTAR